MAVHKRSYRSWSGMLTPERWRFLVLTRYAFTELFAARPFVVLLVACFVPVLITGSVIYIMNNPTAQALLELGRRDFIRIDNRFFVKILVIQGWLAFLMTAWAGPAMVSMDLANNALPLFLSRPFSRAEYVLGKFSVLMLLLSAITWAPVLFLFGLQANLAAGDWLRTYWWMPFSIIAGSLIWITILALIALAASALIKWRIFSTAGLLGLIFIPAGFGTAVNGILRTQWGWLLNLPYLITVIWYDLFGAPLHLDMPGRSQNIPPGPAWIMIFAVCGFSLLLLSRKLQAREVVRG